MEPTKDGKLTVSSYLDTLSVSNKEEIIKHYGEASFTVFYIGEYHTFVKNHFCEFNKGREISS